MTEGEAMANKKLVDLLQQDENANVANEEFETWLWQDLLSEQPQFADKCDKWGEFDRLQKKSLLKNQPQLAKYF